MKKLPDSQKLWIAKKIDNANADLAIMRNKLDGAGEHELVKELTRRGHLPKQYLMEAQEIVAKGFLKHPKDWIRDESFSYTYVGKLGRKSYPTATLMNQKKDMFQYLDELKVIGVTSIKYLMHEFEISSETATKIFTEWESDEKQHL